MTIATLRERLRTAREDDRITVAEVDSIIRGVLEDGAMNFQEALLLQGELDAFQKLFEKPAYKKLKEFLASHPPKR